MLNPIVIIGAHGQDGRLLSEQLEAEGHPVVKIGRGDISLTNQTEVGTLVSRLQPREVYYLAAHHHSAEDTFDSNEAILFQSSFEVHVTGLVNFLEAIRTRSPQTRLFYAASSHIFGQGGAGAQNEQTPFQPHCIYGITKASGVQCCRYYRQKHSVFASAGILYNHESCLRAPQFVSQKIIQSALAIAAGNQHKLVLGDLSARIDWGYAPDYVKAMRNILELSEPDDFIIATGESHSVREFVEIAFEAAGLNPDNHVVESPDLITKSPRSLIGDASKLRSTGWERTVSFRQMVLILLNNQIHDR
jgi:GDPmannose 4,6-dehydratase